MSSAKSLWAIVVLLGALAFSSAPATAQDSDADDAPVPLTLVSQSPFVAADGELEIRFALGTLAPLATPEPVAEADSQGDSSQEGTVEEGTVEESTVETAPAEVAITVYGRVFEPADLRAEPDVAINRRPSGTLSSLPVDAGVVTVRLPIRGGEQFDDIDRMLIPDIGVYPVIVEVRAGETTLGSLRTEMIRLPVTGSEETPPPVPPVAVIMPVGESGTSVDSAIELLNAHPDIPVTPIVSGAALTDLATDQTSAPALVTAIGDRSVIVPVQPDLDPSALASIGRLDRYRQAVTDARAAADALGLPNDTAMVTVGGPQTEAGATELRALGIEHVLDARSIDGLEPLRSRRLAVEGGSLVELAASPVWAELLAGERSPAARTQRLLANLALSDPETPIVINAAAHPENGRETLDELFASLAAPEIPTVPLADLASLSGIETAAPAARPAQDLSAVADHTATTVALLGSYTAFYVSGPGTPPSYDAELDAALALDTDPTIRLDLVLALNRRLESELDTIALPTSQSVTLAARSAPIPLTIENSSRGPRQVMLQFRSDKIAVAQNNQVITIDPGTSSIDVDIEARSLGVSPLQVSLLTPDGERVLSTTRFDVRSTAIPGLGLLISAAGLLLLGAWWYVSIRRKRSAPTDPGDNDEQGDRSEGDTSDRTDVLASGSV